MRVVIETEVTPSTHGFPTNEVKDTLDKLLADLFKRGYLDAISRVTVTTIKEDQWV